jgi:hypothetical protein
VLWFYNKRGTAEQRIKKGKQAVNMPRLSCGRFRSNHVRLALSPLAHSSDNLWRRLAPPDESKITPGEEGEGQPYRRDRWAVKALQN